MFKQWKKSEDGGYISSSRVAIAEIWKAEDGFRGWYVYVIAGNTTIGGEAITLKAGKVLARKLWKNRQ